MVTANPLVADVAKSLVAGRLTCDLKFITAINAIKNLSFYILTSKPSLEVAPTTLANSTNNQLNCVSLCKHLLLPSHFLFCIKCNTSPIESQFINLVNGTKALSLHIVLEMVTILVTYLDKINKNSYCQRQACSRRPSFDYNHRES